MNKLIALCLALLLAPLGNAFAAEGEYPTRPIRLIVPFPPGGAPDIVARHMADDMRQSLGQPIIVENKPGASSNIGMNYVAKSEPDGYTIALASASLAINKSMIKNTPFDPVDDFTPISLIAMVPSVMVVPTSIPADSVQSFIDYAHRHKGELNYGTSGVGTTQHLAGVLFNKRTASDITHIPHKGQNALVPELIAGRVQLSFNNISAVQPFVQSKELKILAIALPERWPEFPNIPTFAQAGLPDFEISSWLALFGPAGMPDAVAQKIYKAARAAMKNPSIQSRVVSAGNYPVVSTPAQLKDFLGEEIKRWSIAVKELEAH